MSGGIHAGAMRRAGTKMSQRVDIDAIEPPGIPRGPGEGTVRTVPRAHCLRDALQHDHCHLPELRQGGQDDRGSDALVPLPLVPLWTPLK